jgi:hypothetical protein
MALPELIAKSNTTKVNPSHEPADYELNNPTITLDLKKLHQLLTTKMWI